MTDPILVTGASGFVGSAVVRALIAEGERVRVLIRPTSARTNIEGLDVEVAEGDVRDPAAVRGALEGCRHLFHVAADYRLWAPDPEEIVRANLEGTRAVMEAARDARIERIVYTSSVATLRLRRDGVPVDEGSPNAPETTIGAYKRSKVVAERLVEAMAGRGPSGRDRAALDPDRAARREADADGPHRRRGRQRQDTGLRRHGTEHRPRRRRGPRPPPRLEEGSAGRALHPGRTGRVARRHADDDRASRRDASRRRSSCRADRSSRSPTRPSSSRASPGANP